MIRYFLVFFSPSLKIVVVKFEDEWRIDVETVVRDHDDSKRDWECDTRESEEREMR